MSYISAYYHCVFSTKERRPLIQPCLQERLWPFLGGIARQNQIKAIEIGGVADHVHVLLSLPSTMAIAKAVQLIKGGSSKWVHDTFPEHRLFGWQVKYGAFGVSVSQLDKIIHYTSKIRPNIITRCLSRRNSLHSSRSIGSHTMNGICGNRIQPSLRDSYWFTSSPSQG